MNTKFLAVLLLPLLVAACGQAPSTAPMSARAAAPVSAKSRVYTLEDMGAGKMVQKALAKAGISNSAHMLEAGRTDYYRERLSEVTGVAPEKILELVQMSDLMRVSGIGPAQARLLIGAGVATTVDLARRNAIFLQANMTEVNGTERMNERTPGLDVVMKWVDEAKTLERVVEY